MAGKKTDTRNLAIDSLSDKSRLLLKSLVEIYIQEGQPVGSKVLAESSELSVSPATIRNLMSDLEEKGYLISPHTSAGRVPTAQAYRLFVDVLLEKAPVSRQALRQMSEKIDPDMTSQEMVASVSSTLSELTNLAGLVMLPRIDQLVMRHIEFLRLDNRRVLLILVLDDHEVQNRVLHTRSDYTEISLREASNFLNHHFAGQMLSSIHYQLVRSMRKDSEHMDSLMQIVMEIAEKAFGPEHNNDYVLSGQENLVDMARDRALEDIRELFKVFSLKGDILHLLDRCMGRDGVHLYIGEESGYQLLDECSLVTASYGKEGEPLGALGVIGPTRMAYHRVIPIVETTARLL
ncbi:MAG: heat-inducible transcriptional repressor HrcA, partial [Gammaproteobacteria bacterium]|nr:heat-inducible transcriptional repressor HrcA [Gammaproteobacteria bacterium]